jgi:hypothetical protein
MPTPSLDPIDAFTYLFSLTVSLGMLYSLLFLLVPQCSALIIKSGGREACTIGAGVSLCP